MRVRMVTIAGVFLIVIWLSGCRTGHDMIRAKETRLKDALFTLRQSLDEYTYDKKHAPQSLDDLVRAGYLKEIPKDPITGNADWTVVVEDPSHSADPNQPGIGDVRSSSNLVGADGTAYSTW